MIVIDASSLSAYILREEGSEKIAQRLREATSSVELVAKETANAIVMAERKKRMSKSQADAALSALRMLVGGAIKIQEQQELLPSSFEISRSEKITVYDAIYIALAKNLGARLLTRDDTQAKVAKSLGVAIAEE